MSHPIHHANPEQQRDVQPPPAVHHSLTHYAHQQPVAAPPSSGQPVFDLGKFWQEEMQVAEAFDSDFKNHPLPLARIKKVMKTDQDVKMISAEAPILFAKGCEIFITELTKRAWVHAEENKRRTLQRSDIATAITKTDMCDFLIDIVPREEATKAAAASAATTTASEMYDPQYAAAAAAAAATIYYPYGNQPPPQQEGYYNQLPQFDQVQQYQMQFQQPFQQQGYEEEKAPKPEQ